MSHESIFGKLALALQSDWRSIARPSQLPPAGDAWSIWLVLAGRGFGKTRTGAEWVLDLVGSGFAKRIALVAPTAADARDVMVEGESGILACSPDWNRPLYEPSKRRLTWPSGAVATTFSAEEPERLRGPQHDASWCDELGAWPYLQETWDQLQFGLRLGKNPRICITTTPRPSKMLKEIIGRAKDESGEVVVTRGRTADNAPNLSKNFLSTIVAKYEGTRLGRQELDAEMLDDVPYALFKSGDVEALRIEKSQLPMLRRIVVAVDPAVTSGENADETGIVVVGIGDDDHCYVLADVSDRLSPDAWARKAIEVYRRFGADRVVAEVNNGGDLVEATLRTADPNVSYRAVHASRGKAVRAEPVAALYEQRKVHHVGNFPQLEDQMFVFTSDFDRKKYGSSPDRLDALVWAITELVISGSNVRLAFGSVTMSSSTSQRHW